MIHFYERDVRKNEPDFNETCGSFSVIQNILKKGLKELNYYEENPDKAGFVGIADCLELGFRYKDKKPFIVAFLDNCNSIASIQYYYYNQNKGVKLFSINQHTADIYNKYGIECKVIGPGIDYDYWKPTKPKNNIFTFFSNTFANYRSGLDMLIPAFHTAFQNNKNVQLIIKDTSNSPRFLERINYYKSNGSNIIYIGERITFSKMRDLYSQSHVFCNVFRHSGHGLGFAEAGLCGCNVLAGDFNPSNKINQHSKLLKPVMEVDVVDFLPYLEEWGLVNTFGNLRYIEQPRFYTYSIDEYAQLLLDSYNKYEYKDNTNIIKENWDYKKSAEKLISFL